MEKDRSNLQREIDDLMAQVDQETKAKINYDKSVKLLEMQLADLNAKADEQTRQLNELSSWKTRVTNENADLQRQLEDSESQINQMLVRRTLTYVQFIEQSLHSVPRALSRRRSMRRSATPTRRRVSVRVLPPSARISRQAIDYKT